MNKTRFLLNISLLCTLGLAAPLAEAQSVLIRDNFTGKGAALDWVNFNGACLTAGDGSGKIPA